MSNYRSKVDALLADMPGDTVQDVIVKAAGGDVAARQWLARSTALQRNRVAELRNRIGESA